MAHGPQCSPWTRSPRPVDLGLRWTAFPHPRVDGRPTPVPWAWGRRQWRCSDATPKPSKPQCEREKAADLGLQHPVGLRFEGLDLVMPFHTEPQRGVWHVPKEMSELSRLPYFPWKYLVWNL